MVCHCSSWSIPLSSPDKQEIRIGKKSQALILSMFDLWVHQRCSICSEPAKASNFKNEIKAFFPTVYKVLGEVTVSYSGK